MPPAGAVHSGPEENKGDGKVKPLCLGIRSQGPGSEHGSYSDPVEGMCGEQGRAGSLSSGCHCGF